MEKKLQHFMDSGLLDSYILGTTTLDENLEVESYIAEFPEVAAEYDRLQENLEILAKANIVEAPKYILKDVLKEISEETPVVQMTPQPRRRTPWFSIAASIAAFVFAGTSFFLNEKNMSFRP